MPETIGLVTAAGTSTRMGGFPKPLLVFEGQRFIERMVEMYCKTSVDEIVVILGHEADAIRSRANLSNATVVTNDDYKSGMLSSVRTGVRVAQEAGVDAMFLSPVDYPLIPSSVIEKLLRRFNSESVDIVNPAIDGSRGHPPLFAASTFDALLSAPEDEGARAVVYGDETTTVNVEVDDERIFVDVDTPAEYWQAVKQYEQPDAI